MGVEIRRRHQAAGLEGPGDLHPVLRRVYGARGVLSAQDLDLSLERLLPVSTLDGVERAAELLAAHRASGRVLVVGDFDADGATGSALLVRAMRSLGFAHVDFLVPNRFRFGYGLTPGIVALAADRRPSLIVTVDNGVSSIEGVEAAHALGIPVLITDHHLPGAKLPSADAIVNPNLTGSGFASPALSGVGVAFYVVAALSRAVRHPQFRPSDLLDLVALGTVADLVPLDRNNRVLVAQGLRRIRAGTLRSRYSRTARIGGPEPGAAHGGRSGLRGRPATECGGPPGRYERGDRLSAHGRRGARAGPRRRAHPPQRGTARNRAAHAGRGDGARRHGALRRVRRRGARSVPVR